MSTKKQFSAIIILIIGLVTIGGWVSGWVSAYSPDYYHQIQKNIEVFGRVYQEISKKYVEEVDPTKFMKAGIEGMLSTLDPYTVLVEKDDNTELQIMSSGKYGGLGMRIGMRSGWPTVVEPPFDGTPALRAGIREGDKIIEVDNKNTKGMSISRVANLLRGEIGSEVFLKIVREGEEEPIEFRLIRAEIIITDVAYADFIEDGIGYIRLSHFSRHAGKDVEKAIRKLKRNNLKSLIVDIRSNPGGLLEAAVNVSENFIEKGKLIVSTQGRAEGSLQQYYSEKSPILENVPLALLVNGLSASASEIVAGAVQDLDRGVIIGANTFGKGLVQTVVPISADVALKITTAKYLVPSGRSIQDPKRFLKDPQGILLFAKNGEKLDHPRIIDEARPDDSSEGAKKEEQQKRVYHTANGRVVYGGSGITPDIIVKNEKLNRFEMELLRKTMPFQFAVIYAAKHPELPRGFEVTDEMLREFEDFLEEKDFEYVTEAEIALQNLEEITEQNEYFASLSPTIDEVRSVILKHKTKEFERSKEFIKQELKKEISAKLWGRRAEVEASFDNDLVIKKALEVLSNLEQYYSVLRGETGIEK
ncbi:MAG: S41 family peptidase [bacterium]